MHTHRHLTPGTGIAAVLLATSAPTALANSVHLERDLMSAITDPAYFDSIVALIVDQAGPDQDVTLAVAVLAKLRAVAKEQPDIAQMDGQGIAVGLQVDDTGEHYLELTFDSGGTRTFALAPEDIVSAQLVVNDVMPRGFDDHLTQGAVGTTLPVSDDHVSAYVATGFGIRLRSVLREFVDDVRHRIGAIGLDNPRRRTPIIA